MLANTNVETANPNYGSRLNKCNTLFFCSIFKTIFNFLFVEVFFCKNYFDTFTLTQINLELETFI
jgi:hypothetical protein